MARDRRHEVKRVLMVALTINVAMTLLKMVVGLASGSLAVVADAMHSATDALSSLTGLITNGLCIASAITAKDPLARPTTILSNVMATLMVRATIRTRLTS